MKRTIYKNLNRDVDCQCSTHKAPVRCQMAGTNVKSKGADGWGRVIYWCQKCCEGKK